MNAELSYVFLLLDLSDYGEPTLRSMTQMVTEKMSNMVGKVAVVMTSAAGLLYEYIDRCKLAIRNDGKLRAATATHGQQVLWTPGEPKVDRR